MTFSEQFVAMTVAVLQADGKMEQEEFDSIRSIANDLELNAAEVNNLINAEIANPKTLKAAAKGVKKTEAEALLDACVAVALADKYIDHREIELLISIAELLKLQPSKAVLTIATFAQNDRSILIEGNATLHADEELEVEDDEN